MNAPSDEELALYVEHGAALIGLAIPPALRDAVLQNARILAGHAATVLQCEIPATTEVAPEFRP